MLLQNALSVRKMAWKRNIIFTVLFWQFTATVSESETRRKIIHLDKETEKSFATTQSHSVELNKVKNKPKDHIGTDTRAQSLENYVFEPQRIYRPKARHQPWLNGKQKLKKLRNSLESVQGTKLHPEHPVSKRFIHYKPNFYPYFDYHNAIPFQGKVDRRKFKTDIMDGNRGLRSFENERFLEGNQDANYFNYYHENFENPLRTQKHLKSQHYYPTSPRIIGEVHIPGEISVKITGRQARIHCQFPKFLIIIQKIHWHHQHDGPFGTYYDATNGFAPRILTEYPDKWTSILIINDYSIDDYGKYKCLSSALLPNYGTRPFLHQNNLFLSTSASVQQGKHKAATSLNKPDDKETKNHVRTDKKLRDGNALFRNERSLRINSKYLKFPATNGTQARHFKFLTKRESSSTPGKIKKYAVSKTDTSHDYKSSYFIPSNRAEHLARFWQTQHHPPPHYDTYDFRYYTPGKSIPLNTNYPLHGHPNEYLGYNYGLYAPFFVPSFAAFKVYQEIIFDHDTLRS